MKDEEIKKLYEFEQHYWWHVGRREIFKTFLKRISRKKDSNILEIGCGTGGNIQVLSHFGKVTGLDISEDALRFCKKRGLTDLILSNAEDIDLPSESFDVIVAFDVLEHIEKDDRALKEVFRLLTPGGYFLATVPAYQFLWSEHDIALGHVRRYTASGFSEKIARSGLQTLKTSYLISFIFPAVVAYRMMRKVIHPKSRKNTAYVGLPSTINNFFIFLLNIEARLLNYVRFPFGTSVICLAKKPRNGEL